MTIVDILVDYIKGGVINYKTGLPFTKDDIKDATIKVEVEAKLASL